MKLTLTVLLLSLSLSFGEVAVVANPSFGGSADVEDLLLGYSDRKVVIYLTDNREFNDMVLRKLIGISYEDFKMFWLEKALDGRGVPPRELPPEEVYRKVRERKDAIGILPLEFVRDLKVLRIVR